MSWREARALSMEAEAERLAEFLVEVDDVEQLCDDDETLCVELRTLAGRVRTRASGCRDEAEAQRAALADHIERAAG